MTNTIYFDIYRDDNSESTSPEVTEELSAVDQERRPVSSSLYSVIGKAFSAWSFKRSGNLRHNNTDTVLSDRNGKPHFSASGRILEVDPNGWNLPTPHLRKFTFSELKKATKNFRHDFIIGEGGFGTVFKGWIKDNNLSQSGGGYDVAVKKLNPESMQGREEWQAEVNFLGRLSVSHLNIVRLLGHCSEGNELLLVYEYMQKGSLETHLFPSKRAQAHRIQMTSLTDRLLRRIKPYVDVELAWKLRLKIMVGAARALAFLHSSENNIIYRDFKASNLLLDVNYNAKLTDFGLAKHGPVKHNSYVTIPESGGFAAAEYLDSGNSHVTTRVMGTYGYAAPEYVATGHLYVKTDVYGFGVVLLEILTCQRVIDTNRPSGQHNLVEWIKPSLSDRRKLLLIMDPKLKNQYSSKAAKQTAELILKCLQQEPQNRPSMEEVVHSLEHIQVMESKLKEVPPPFRGLVLASSSTKESNANPYEVKEGEGLSFGEELARHKKANEWVEARKKSTAPKKAMQATQEKAKEITSPRRSTREVICPQKLKDYGHLGTKCEKSGK